MQQFGGGIGREMLAERIREEVPQEEYVEAVQGAGAFADQGLASVGGEPQDFDVAFRAVLGLDRAEPIISQSGEGNEGSVQAVVFASVAGREHAHA